MLKFTQFSSHIKVSERRVLSIWSGHADHLNLNSAPDFSGTVLVAAIFSLTARMQYYVLFYSGDQNVIENWRVEPSDIPISMIETYETELINLLKSMNIQMNRITPENPNHSRLLRRLPLEFSSSEDSAQADFDIFNDNVTHSSLDEADLNTLKKFCIHF
ncbi:MAG: hypothetical protein IJM59_01600 [Proteobacteria bacterium]|nr:hypothetical protein [Pseudomonadota bacterium]